MILAIISKCEQNASRGRGGMVDATDLSKIEPYRGNSISESSQIQGNLRWLILIRQS